MHDIEHTRLIERRMISIPNVSINHCKKRESNLLLVSFQKGNVHHLTTLAFKT